MIRTLYAVSAHAALSVVSWGLGQVGSGVGAVRRQFERSPEKSDTKAPRQSSKRGGSKKSLE
jgi:hypothetical protein